MSNIFDRKFILLLKINLKTKTEIKNYSAWKFNILKFLLIANIYNM